MRQSARARTRYDPPFHLDVSLDLHLLAADPTVTLDEIEAALRDAAAHSDVVACPGKTFRVVTGGMPEWRAALVEAGVTAQQNRQALAGEPT